MAERTIPFNQLAKAGYNRGIRRAHVNKIKKNFREDLVQPTIVSFRDGKYWVVDHQHLSQAIYELNGCDPNTPIRCDVKTGLTYEQEAQLYYLLNTSSVALTFADTLVGRIEAKDPEALRFRNVVESCGYVIGGSTNNSLNAVRLAWNVFERDGEPHLVHILSLTHACWPNDKAGVDSRIIRGISMFLTHHGDNYQTDHFVKTLSQEDPRSLSKKATSFYKQMDSKSFTMPYCSYVVIVNCYNAGLRNKVVAVAPGS